MKPSLNRPFLFWFCWSENWRVSNGWGNEEDGAPGRLRMLLRSMSPVERTLDQHSTRAECKRTDSLDFRMRSTDQREKACKRGDGKAGLPSALQEPAACHRPTRFGLLLVPLQPRQLFDIQTPSNNAVPLLARGPSRVPLARVRSVFPFLSLAFKAAWAWLARSWSPSEKTRSSFPSHSLPLITPAQQSFQFVRYSSSFGTLFGC